MCAKFFYILIVLMAGLFPFKMQASETKQTFILYTPYTKISVPPGESISYSIDVIVKKEEKVYKDACRRLGKANVLQTEKKKYHFPAGGTQPQKHPTVIVGCGPAGLFCGYYLALHGYRPVILERGADVDTRQADVERFWETGKLQPDSNVQFGEGGAGTFSDGKLNTLEG